jgi:UDP-glucuronate 4-epimerase
MFGKILLTGGAGFIGSQVTKELLNRGYNVVAVDSLSDYYSIELKEIRIAQLKNHKNFVFEKVDISDMVQVENLFLNHKFVGVIHLAAQAGVRLPLERFGHYIDSNIVGFYNILRKTLEVNIQNFLYASSSSVYGDISPLPYTESSILLSPKSFYGATKLNNEQTANILASGKDISTRGLRFFTVYGEWGRPDMAYFRLMAAALGKHKFRIFGDGSIERDFTYIEDVTQTTIDLFENMSNSTQKTNDIVNIGGQRPLSMNFLIELVQEITGTRFSVAREQSNRNDTQKTVADNTYLRSLVGKRTFTPLEEGIKNFYSWMTKPEIIVQVEKWIKSSI